MNTKPCRECGRVLPKNMAHGLCQACSGRLARRARGVPARPDWGKFTSCRACGKKPVAALGLCKLCYGRHLETKNAKRRREQKYRAGERQRFGGRYDSLLLKASGKCQVCGLTEADSLLRWHRRLDVHHKDGNGRTSDHPNHSDENLMILCRPCHMSQHVPRGKRFQDRRRSA